MRLLGLALGAWLTAGCYYYRPIEQTPSAEMYVSAALTDSGTERLWRYLGPDVASVRGRLLSADDSAYGMSVYAVDLRHGSSLSWKGERVVLQRQWVDGFSERQFSLGRTTLAGGITVAAFMLTVQAFKIAGNGSSGGGGGGKPR